MVCPRLLQEAAGKCPFLRNVSENTSLSLEAAVSKLAGPEIARGGGRGPIFEEPDAFGVAFNKFHGENGVVPLRRKAAARDEAPPAPLATGPSHAPTLPPRPPVPAFASISMRSFGPSMPMPGGNGQGSNLGRNCPERKQGAAKNGGSEPQSRKSEQFSTKSLAGGASGALSASVAGQGMCPLRKAGLGGLIDLTYGKGVKLTCPAAVVKMRAAVNRMPAVRALRPQAIEVRVLAVMALAGMANMPLGVWREHTRKFSPQWFLAVHASIPFVAMARKAVLMPHQCVAFTIAAAIVGQTVGARAEKARVDDAKCRGQGLEVLGAGPTVSVA